MRGDRSTVRNTAPSAGIGETKAYRPVFVIGVNASGLTGIGLNCSMAGEPMPAEVAEVEPIEPVEDIDMPVIELIPLMVDAGLMVTGLDPADVLVMEDIDLGEGAGANEGEILIPAGT